MPLIKGRSQKVIGENISEMEEGGHPANQAIAASLSSARQAGAKIPKKRAKSSEDKYRGWNDTQDNYRG
jgi:hypothetical protein